MRFCGQLMRFRRTADQNKIKIVFASYCSKAENTTFTIWLFRCKIFEYFSGPWFSVFGMEKTELGSVIK